MTQYREPSWTKTRGYVPPGSIETWDLFSETFAETKSITVYLPHEYQAQKNTLSYFVWMVKTICNPQDYNGLDNLIHLNKMLPTIVLLDSNDRSKEYAANPLFATFLHDELFSALHQRYRIASDPEQRGILGAGLGAVAALHTHWRHPELFGKLLLQAGHFYFTDVGDHDWGSDWDDVRVHQ